MNTDVSDNNYDDKDADEFHDNSNADNDKAISVDEKDVDNG